MAPPDRSDSTRKKGKTRDLKETVVYTGASDTKGEAAEAGETIPKSFGRYEILETLGEGAMGAVYLAHDSQLNRKVAIKTPKFTRNADERLIKRFYREARSAAGIRHPCVCSIYDVGENDDVHYITMEYIDGHPLSDYINAAKPQPQRDVARLIRKVALGLHEAHSQGVVHRDLKPANIMIDTRGEPIVMDFGLACHAEQTDDVRLTNEGSIVGSPAYMSPEQIEGNSENIGPAADVYALGVVLYELLTGHLPFTGKGSTMAMIGAILTKEPDDPIKFREDLDPKLSKICLTAMSKSIEGRIPSMRDFAIELANYLKDSRKGASAQEASTAQANASSRIATLQATMQEQTKIVRALYEDGEYSAAAKVLEKMTQVADPQVAKYTEWAKNELSKLWKKLYEEPASRSGLGLLNSEFNDPFDQAVLEPTLDLPTDPALGSHVGLGSDPGIGMQPGFTQPASLQPTLQRPSMAAPAAKHNSSDDSFPRWLLWLIPIPIFAIIILIIAIIMSR
jgi:serine/threonine protein kinase